MTAHFSIIKSILTVGGWTSISRILGFVRDLLIANFLGAGAVADAFFVAFKLPNLFRSLFAEGAFNVAFVPLFSEQLETKGKDTAHDFSKLAFSALFYIVLLFTAVAEILMPVLVLIQAPGFLEDTTKFHSTILMARITFPYLLLVSLNSLQSGVLNSLGSFAAPALTPVLLNITMIASLFVFTPLLGDNYGYALSCGVTVAGVLQFIWLAYHTKKQGFPLGLKKPAKVFKEKSTELKLLLKRIIPGVFGSGIYQINLFLDTLFVSFLATGAVSWLYYANRLYQLPVGIIGAAIGTALLPILTRQLKAKELSQAKQTLNKAIEFSLLISIPATLGLIVLSTEIISILFERGAFLASDSKQTATALSAYAIGLPAYILTKTLAPVFYARGDTSTPVKIAAVALVLYITLCAVFLPFLDYVGIAFATGIVAWINVLQYIYCICKNDYHTFESPLIKRCFAILTASMAMGICVYFAKLFITKTYPLWQTETYLKFGVLVGLISIGAISYAAFCLLTKAVRIKELKKFF